MPLTGMELKQILKMLEDREKKHIAQGLQEEQGCQERQGSEPDKDKQRTSST